MHLIKHYIFSNAILLSFGQCKTLVWDTKYGQTLNYLHLQKVMTVVLGERLGYKYIRNHLQGIIIINSKFVTFLDILLWTKVWDS